MPSGTVNLDSPDDKWGHRDFLGPVTSQAARLLPMQAQPIKRSLRPLPVREILLLGERRDLRMPLNIALERAGTDEVAGIGHGMHYCL